MSKPKIHPAERLGEFADILDVGAGAFAHRGRWTERFRQQHAAFNGRLIVEIGCFDGGLLAAAAGRWPTAGFVGIDWKAGSLADAAERVTTAGLTNVRLIRGRGQDIARSFADGEVDQVWLFHPEPCDRDVERPNRLVNPAFLADVHRVLRPGEASRFVMKTDHAEYYQHTLAVLADTPSLGEKFRVVANSVDYWNDAPTQALAAAHAFAGEVTAYEARYRRKRLPIYYVELAKRHQV
jgi:tRNA (guanine-N7-)-methyltransferase